MSSKASALAALAKLKAAKKDGGGVSKLVEIKDERVFDEVTEEEYAKIVAQRRKASDFVEDDDGLGYADDGEEGLGDDDAYNSGEDDGGDDEEVDGAAAVARAKAKSGRAGQSLLTAAGVSNSLKSSLGKASRGMSAKTLKDEDRKGTGYAAGGGMALDMDDMLGEISTERAPRRQSGAGASSSYAYRTPLAPSYGSSSSSSSSSSSRYADLDARMDAMLASGQISAEGVGPEEPEHAGGGYDYGREYDGGDGGVEGEMDLGDGSAEGAAEGEGEGEEGGRRPAIKRGGLAARQAQKAAAAAAAAPIAAAAPVTPTPAPSSGAGPASWLASADFSVGAGGDAGSGLAGVTGAVVSSDELDKARPGLPPIASLMERVPLPAPPARPNAPAPAGDASPFAPGGAESEQLLFFWLDAHEDPWGRPGVLHLFGKVCTNAPAVLAAKRHNEEVARERAAAAAAAAAAASAAAAPVAPAAGDDGAAPSAAAGASSSSPSAAPPKVRLLEPAPTFASACVTVTGLERTVFVLPRESSPDGEPIGMGDVYGEVREVLTRHMGAGGVKFRAKPVKRCYAFELEGVPREESGYFKVTYDGRAKPLPASALSGRTYSHVFGVGSSLLEQFLLKRDMMGPCWLRLRGARPSPSPYSWCAYDLTLESPKGVSVYGRAPRAKANWRAYLAALPASLREVPLEPPPLVVMSLSTRTVVDPRKHTHEVVAVSMTTHREVHQDGPSKEHASMLSTRTIVRPLSPAQPLPADLKAAIVRMPPHQRASYVVEASERALLNHVLNAVGRVDPDVLVGHNITGFDLDVLLHRADAAKAQLWSRLGRLRRTSLPRATMGAGGRLQFSGNLTVGRLVCDTYLAARELLRETTYTLTSLAERHLGAKRPEIDPAEVPRHLTSSGPAAQALMDAAALDGRLSLGLMFKLQVLPLTKQLTTLAGNLWSRSLRGARAERIEYLLLHEFHTRKFIVPDKPAYGAGGGGGSGGGKGGKEGAAAADDNDVPDAPGGEDDDEEGGGGGGGGGRRVGGSGTIARGAKKRGKPAYSGGLVLEPKRGLYDKCVLMLDFNSLYPSIIQEYNICFTTVERPLTPLESAHAAAGGGSGGSGGGASAGSKRKAPGGKGASSSSSSSAKKAKRADGSAVAAGGEEDAAGGAGEGGEEDGEEGEGEGGEAVGGGGPLIPPLPDLARYPELGVLPTVIRNLVLKRRAVKATMAKERDPALRDALEIRQKALKILANSMYGCLGFAHSRFHAKPIAALVTSQGRDILQRTMDLATDVLGADVIYGDTDSLFLYTGTTDLGKVKEMGAKLKKEVNKLYRYLEIEVDGIFKSMLLLKKKKYAAVELHEGPGGVVTETREAKGLDLVRRDWCLLSRELGDDVLKVLLSGKEKDAIVEEVHDRMRAVAADLREGRVAVEKFVITKGLNKAPQDYPDVKGQPHLQVALAMLKAGKTVNVGDHVPFVICQETVGTVATGGGAGGATAGTSPGADAAAAAAPGDSSPGGGSSPSGAAGDAASPSGARGGSGGQGGSFVMRAYHPDEVKKAGGALHIDIEWYLSTQILPPIARLCEPIDGTSQARLAECLGLDTSRFARIGAAASASRDDDMFLLRYSLPFEQRFKDCEPFYTVCSACSHTERFGGAFVLEPANSADAVPSVRCGLDCPSPGCSGLLIPFGVGDISKMTAVQSLPKNVDPAALCASRFANLAISSLRSRLLSYEQGSAICDDAVCGFGTRSISTQMEGHRCARPGCRGGKCSLQNESSSLNMWVEYLAALFDFEASKAEKEKKDPRVKVPGVPKSHSDIFRAVEGRVSDFLERCAYHFVSKSVFRYVSNLKK